MNEERLIKYIGAVVTGIVEEIAAAEELNEEENAAALIEQINSILDQFGLTIEQVIPQQLLLNYFGGVDEATGLLVEAGALAEKTLALTSNGQVAQGFQRKIHMEALGEMVDDTLLDLKAAIRTAKGNAGASIRSALEGVRGDISRGLIAGDANKIISKRVMDSFNKNGLTSFVTRDGKRLPLDLYSRLTVRTKMRDASVKGSANRYKESDVGLVKITGRGDTCSVCAQYQGLVVSLTGEHEGFPTTSEVPLPPYHPSCRDGIVPYVAEYKSDEEIQEAKDKWNQWEPGEDKRTAAQKRAYEREQEARRVANQEQKQFMRWQMVMGAEAPKTLGGFRRMKRQNTPRFQELQSEYMSIAQRASSQ